MLHHLVIFDAQLAQSRLSRIPQGRYLTEPLLYFDLAQSGGAHYVPRVGYVWRRSLTGLHRQPQCVSALVNSRRWMRDALKGNHHD